MDASRQNVAIIGGGLAAGDEQGLIDRIRKSMKMDTLPDIVKSAMEDINADSMIMWVFYSIPRLERWTSEKRRVAILGDAAHAIPPTTGQGASQAFEDVMLLALLLSTLKENPGSKWEEALDFWQKMRQDRIDDLFVLTKQLGLGITAPIHDRAHSLNDQLLHPRYRTPSGAGRHLPPQH